MSEMFEAYLITFGWAITGSVSMGLGIIIALRLFDLSTTNLDEWDELKKGNMAVAVLLSSIVISLGLVIAAAIR
ncbi:MAG: DUF350 domain-containing protein [Planctomycetaceae bacterium]|nr:DUF350 domain-containing protein [Planctomycetaceae bacterium]MCB9953980.1 DUF350 domain-containing protein [Planctomycetaceae bacterium]